MFISMLRRRRLDIESLNSDTMTSRPSLMNSGKRVAVHTDHRKKIGSVPQKNCDPALTPADPVLGDDGCPKRFEMEPIES